MKIKILSARRQVLSGEAKEVILPGEDGELSVLDFHQPCLSRLKAGQITVKSRDAATGAKRKESFFIRKGIARMGYQGISILVEEAGQKTP